MSIVHKLSHKESPTQNAILEVIAESSEPLSPKQIIERSDLSESSVRTTVRRMLDDGLLVQPGYGLYDLPSESETDKEAQEDVEDQEEDVSGRPTRSPDQTAQLEAVPILGGDGPGTSSRMMQIDSDLLRATGIDLDGATLIPIMGSSAEPYLSHGQIALATPTDRIQGEDLYVYYSWINEAHLVAWMERTDDGITFETGNRKSSYVCEDEDDLWTRDDGKTERIRIVGRVVGAMMPVGKMRAQKKELARIIMEA